MMLVEEGALGLDDAVATHIPAWKNLGVYASGMPTLLADAPPSFITTPPQRPMKVVDLVTHTSGLTYGFMMRTAVDAAYRRAEDQRLPDPGRPRRLHRAARAPCRWSSRRGRPGTIRSRST